MGSDVDDAYERLLISLAELDDVLTLHGEDHWAGWVRSRRSDIERGQRHGLDSLLSAFGGMGSLNDVLLHPANGHRLRDDQVARVNADLDRITNEVYAAARTLQREPTGSDRAGAKPGCDRP